MISEKGGAERRETFEQEQVTVGRVQGNDLMLPKGNVSKRHCRIERQNGRFLVSDQESTNGTYVNRRRITQATVVQEGDRIYVGDFILRIEPSSPESLEPISVEPAPEPPPRAPMSTASDERPSQGAAGARSTPDGMSKPARESDGGTERSQLIAFGGVLARRVVALIEPRLLDREVDPTLERRIERWVDDTFNELAIEGDVPAGVDEARVKAAVVEELSRLGPLTALMVEPGVSEIAVTGAGHIAVMRSGRVQTRDVPFLLPESVARVVTRLCKAAAVDPGEASGARHLPLTKLGFELHLLGSDIVPGTAALRLVRRDAPPSSLEGLVRAGVVSRTMATFLRHCIGARVNILVVGATRSGASDILSALVTAADADRVLGLPSPDGLDRNHAGVVWLDVPEARLESVLGAAATLLNHRLLIDGVSPSRMLAALSALAEGAQGTIMRLKARSIESGLSRICTDVSLARPGVTPFVVAEALVASFDIAIEVARLPDGRCRVLRISELERGETWLVKANDIFDFAVERTATGGSIEGSFRATGHNPQVVNELRNQGISIDLATFSRPPASDER